MTQIVPTAQERRDTVIVVIRYDQDCADDVLGIHEATEGVFEGVTAVRAVFGVEAGPGFAPSGLYDITTALAAVTKLADGD